MLAKVLSSAVIGIDASIVEVEVDISIGLPCFTTVGLPETAVKESKERVKAAIKNSGYHFPDDRITVNLAPAHIKKEGTGFDLPIAVGLLCATGMVSMDGISEFLILGELSLDGRVKPVNGSLPMAIAAKEAGYKGIIVPYQNRKEASVVKDIDVFAIQTLGQLIDFLRGFIEITPEEKGELEQIENKDQGGIDFYEVMGQEHAKRALEIAASGNHNCLMLGPPGSGKTMLARRMATILPPLTFEEALETTKIYSVVGMLKSGEALVRQRPFRAPHHTISDAGLIGGGHIPKPGEVSLAHNGVLFLDELPEYKKHVLEVLRQPMEDQQVTIARAATTITYPARFMLIAALNPCPCGYIGDPKHECRCTDQQVHRYRSKISGPLMDRIDIHIEVPAVPYKDLMNKHHAESSQAIRERVTNCREIQIKRLARTKLFCNAQMDSRHIKKYCELDNSSRTLLETAIDRLGFSARAYNRVLKIARTIADLEQEANIRQEHVSEAIQYRNLDREYYN